MSATRARWSEAAWILHGGTDYPTFISAAPGKGTGRPSTTTNDPDANDTVSADEIGDLRNETWLN